MDRQKGHQLTCHGIRRPCESSATQITVREALCYVLCCAEALTVWIYAVDFRPILVNSLVSPSGTALAITPGSSRNSAFCGINNNPTSCAGGSKLPACLVRRRLANPRDHRRPLIANSRRSAVVGNPREVWPHRSRERL